MAILKTDPLEAKSIDTVKRPDAKEGAIRMNEKGYAYKTINKWKRSLKTSFYIAIADDCIRKNLFNFLDTSWRMTQRPPTLMDTKFSFSPNQSGYPKATSCYGRMFKELGTTSNTKRMKSSQTSRPYLLHLLSQCGNESESVTVHYGPFQHDHGAARLRTRNMSYQ